MEEACTYGRVKGLMVLSSESIVVPEGSATASQCRDVFNRLFAPHVDTCAAVITYADEAAAKSCVHAMRGRWLDDRSLDTLLLLPVAGDTQPTVQSSAAVGAPSSCDLRGVQTSAVASAVTETEASAEPVVEEGFSVDDFLNSLV